MTRRSIRALLGSSLRPSCSCTAVKIAGVSGGSAIASPDGSALMFVGSHWREALNFSVRPVLSITFLPSTLLRCGHSIGYLVAARLHEGNGTGPWLRPYSGFPLPPIASEEEGNMEIKRYVVHDTRLGLCVTARSLESAKTGAAQMNQVAGYTRFVARTITEVR